MTDPLSCGGGSGTACYPDHDGDGLPGITASITVGAAEYVGPYQDGLCSHGGSPYYFWGLPTAPDLGAGGLGRGVRAQEAHLGLRASLAADACPQGGTVDAAYRVESSAVGCAVNPTSLDPYGFFDGMFGPDPRIASMDYTCTTDEAQFVNRSLPQFRALGRGERPGEVRRLNGWIFIDRDIDRRVSEGTRVDTVTLDGDTDGEPTCAQVRATFR